MTQRLAVLACAAMVAVPTAAPAQSVVEGSLAILEYGALTVGAIRRVARGNGEADVRPGARIRVRVADTTFEGTVVTLTADSMVVETPTGMRPLASRDATELRVSVGERSEWAEGYFWGLALGGGGGALLGLTGGNEHGALSGSPEQHAVVFGVAYGVIGSLAGAAIGAVTSREAWAAARKPFGGGSLTITPSFGRRPGLAVRLTL